MGRLPNWRRVGFVPEITYFRPAGARVRGAQEVCLTLDEAEAIRLKDLEGLDQVRCAQSMRVSRTTFARILDTARHKVADALLHGKAIRIQGGYFEMAMRRFRCLNGHEWDIPFETMIAGPPQFCPTCDTPSIMPIYPPGFAWYPGSAAGRGRRGRGWRYGP